MIGEMVQGFTALADVPDYKLPDKYPRTPGYRPHREENKYNAW